MQQQPPGAGGPSSGADHHPEPSPASASTSRGGVDSPDSSDAVLVGPGDPSTDEWRKYLRASTGSAAVEEVLDLRQGHGVQVTLGSPAGPTIQINQFLSPGATNPLPADLVGPVPEAATVECPYPGMVTFETDDAANFYGRGKLTRELVTRVELMNRAGGMVFVVGASGSGKSSLLRAGLVPALQAGRLAVPGAASWPRLLITPGPRPLEALATGVAVLAGLPAGTVLDQLIGDPDRFDLHVRQALLTHPPQRAQENAPSSVDLSGNERGHIHGVGAGRLVLIVDQLEEIFAPDIDELTRQRFLQALVAASAPRVPESAQGPARPDADAAAMVVVGLRADFFAPCADSPLLRPHLRDLVVVGPMTENEVREAIERPAMRAGIRLEPGLTDFLLTDLRLSAEAGSLPFLAHALRETWERRTGNVLTVEGYRSTGGVQGSVRATAEQLFTGLDEQHREALRQVMLRLVTISDDAPPTRRHVRRAELVSTMDPQRAAVAHQVLEHLVAARLVTASDRWVEISHEALIGGWPRLTTWLDADRVGLHLQRQLTDAARQWEHSGREDSLLYRGSRLQDTRAWAFQPNHRDDLSPTEHKFLQEGQRAEARRTRTVRAGIAGLVVLLIGTLVATTLAIRDSRATRKQQLLALSRQLAAESDNLSTGDSYTATLLATAALRIAPTVQARYSARNLLTQGWNAILGHTDALSSVAFTGAGTMLASASIDGTVRLWDPVQHREIGQPLTGHRGPVDAVAFSRDGRTIASAGADGTVRLWDPVSRRQLEQPLTGHRGAVTAVAFNRDRTMIASAGADGTVRLWDPVSHSQLGQPMIPGGGAVYGVAFSPNGKTLATGGADHTVRLWDTTTHRPVGKRMTGHNSDVWGVAFSPDGKTLASASGDHTVRLWNPATQQQIGQLQGHTDTVNSAVFSPDGRMLATASADHTVRLWDLASQEPIGEPLAGHVDAVYSAAFSPDGKTVASASGDRTLRLWDLSRHRQVGPSLLNATEAEANVAFSPDGKTLAGCGADHMVRLWNVATHEQIGQPLLGHTGPVHAVAFSPDGKSLTTASDDRTVRLWDVASHRQIGQPLLGHTGPVYAVAFSPDGKGLATASDDRTVRLWDVASHRQIGQPLTGHKESVTSVAFSHDGKTLVSGSNDTTVRLWDVAAHRQIDQPLTGHSNAVNAVAFSPDGNTVASGSDDHTVRLWDRVTHKQLGQPLTGHNDAISAVAFAPDGTTLASSSVDSTVRVWDLASYGQLGEPLTGHSSGVNGVTFSPDGTLLATSSWDNTIRLWNIAIPSDVTDAACAAVGRPMTHEEWARYLPGEPYQETCPSRR